MYLVRFLEEVIADCLVPVGLSQRVERRHERVRSSRRGAKVGLKS